LNAPRLSALAALAMSVLAVSLTGCAEDAVVIDGLYLEARSEKPANNAVIDRLQVLFWNDNRRWPQDADSPEGVIELGGRDLVGAPLLLLLETEGATFGRTATVNARIVGLAGNTPVSEWMGTLELGSTLIQKVNLLALTDACDLDGDLFFDCSIPGCCPAGESLSDCEPDDPGANPLAFEPLCEPCDDTADQDCDGEDRPCIDTDNDGIADCLEAQAGCGLDDALIGPGLEELCDGVDNDCDGETDEGFALVGNEELKIGDPCGQPNSPCEGGIVVCGNPSPRCTSDMNKLAEEICNNFIDDDCDGDVDQGCIESDLDGDGFVGDQDCNDYNTAFNVEAPEPCCPTSLSEGVDPQDPPEEILEQCDFNCDGAVGFCATDDLDGDGFSPPADCDDSDPMTNPGAVDVCGDGIDNDCFGGDVDCATVEDDDGDGYPNDVDCQPDDPFINPSVPEACDGIDNNCNQQIDEGNPGGGGECGIDTGECSKGVNVCAKTTEGSQTKCVDGVFPAPTELCDGLDNDCDGQTDEELNYEGIPIGAPCDGRGSCGVGVVECGPGGVVTCSTNPDGSAPEDEPEVCDSADNDCDGEINEGLTNVEDSTCKQVGVCAKNDAVVLATCSSDGTWECDYSLVPNYSTDGELFCDGDDEDCDGLVDEDFGVGTGCDGDDEDACFNGVVQCDGPDATFCFEEGDAIEICDGEDNDCDGETDEGFVLGGPCDSPDDADKCENGVIVCAADGSGTTCSEEPGDGLPELCDGIDNDCDGVTDEGYDLIGEPCDDPAELGDFCANGVYACAPNGLGVICADDEPVVDVCDGQDNNCDGLIDELAVALGQPCDGDDDDSCADGVYVCPSDGSNTELACTDDADSVVELCNNLDDDCDGETDETLTTDGISAGCLAQGVCGTASVTATCSAGQWSCDYTTATGYLAQEEGSADGCDGVDNDCDGLTDEGYADGDFDEIADCVDADLDGDTINDNENGFGFGFNCVAGQTTSCDDNCPFIPNNDQGDIDNDGIGNECDDDKDGDTIANADDNCPDDPNQNQADSDGDGLGDACETLCQPLGNFCDPDGRTLQQCAADGSGANPAAATSCNFICHDDACLSPSNITGSSMGSCGSNAPDVVVPFGVTALVGDQEFYCPNCQGMSGNTITPHATTNGLVQYCFGSLVVQNGGSIVPDLTVGYSSDDPIVFMVDGNVTVAGSIDISGKSPSSNSTGGAGGNGGGKGGDRCGGNACDGDAGAGSGGGPGGKGSNATWGEGSGGAGGSFGGKGGDGGDSEAENGASAVNGYGAQSLTPLDAGSGGGGGGRKQGDSDHRPGGGGGGALQFSVRGQFTLASSGTMLSHGGQGGTGSGRGGGGGGGSGGAFLIEAATFVNQGGTITVNGGNGGSAAAGGGGAGASQATGVNGAKGSSDSGGGEGGAGGGGGSGRVRIDAVTGADCFNVQPNARCSSGSL